MIDCGGRHQIHICLYVLSISQIQQNAAAVYGYFDGLGSIPGNLHNVSAAGIRFKITVCLLCGIFRFGIYRIQIACQVLDIYNILLIQCRVTVRIQCYYHIIDARKSSSHPGRYIARYHLLLRRLRPHPERHLSAHC